MGFTDKDGEIYGTTDLLKENEESNKKNFFEVLADVKNKIYLSIAVPPPPKESSDEKNKTMIAKQERKEVSKQSIRETLEKMNLNEILIAQRRLFPESPPQIEEDPPKERQIGEFMRKMVESKVDVDAVQDCLDQILNRKSDVEVFIADFARLAKEQTKNSWRLSLKAALKYLEMKIRCFSVST